jgi:hypothetical protein
MISFRFSVYIFCFVSQFTDFVSFRRISFRFSLYRDQKKKRHKHNNNNNNEKLRADQLGPERLGAGTTRNQGNTLSHKSTKDLPPTNSSKGEILCIAFKHTKLYLVVAYMLC